MNSNYANSWPSYYAPNQQLLYNNGMYMQNAGYYPSVDGWRFNMSGLDSKPANGIGRTNLEARGGNNRLPPGRMPMNMRTRRGNNQVGPMIGLIPGMIGPVLRGAMGGARPLIGGVVRAGMNNALPRGGGGGFNLGGVFENLRDIAGGGGGGGFGDMIGGGLGDIDIGGFI
ncbi:hypothetical protein I4U23_016215 [Adineta vaga]|nr:hypothetical protein I4U23_016215 [Adineta vaga]